MKRSLACVASAVGLTLCLALPAVAGPSRASGRAARAGAGLLLHLVQPSSWGRAKSDYPVLGRYSSDDETVMRTHVRWARTAGITGFVVSWKRSPVLDRRLDLLVRVAQAENFKLAIIYQGLDFFRRPSTWPGSARTFAGSRSATAANRCSTCSANRW